MDKEMNRVLLQYKLGTGGRLQKSASAAAYFLLAKSHSIHL